MQAVLLIPEVSRAMYHDDTQFPISSLRVDTVEFIGILNVKVIGGTKLAIRDMSSSDPYVVLTLGQQKAQTSVIKGNLNPVWNEELKLSVPRQYGPLNLVIN